MIFRKSLLGVAALVVVLLLGACTAVQPSAPEMSTIPPATPESEMSTIPPAAPTAAFVLPDGNTCLFAGTGATLAFDGKRVNYTCDMAPEGKMVGILGDPVPTGETEWQVEVATLAHGDGGFTLESSETIEFTAWMISLAAGARCLHAGFGATMGFDDSGRLDYTCDVIAADAPGPANGGEWGIFGQLTNAGEGVWLANRIEFGSSADGFTQLDSAQVPVLTVSGVDPNAASTTAPSADMGAATLAGTSWQWVQTQYGDGSIVEAADPAQYTLTFNEDGTVSAQLDCNNGAGEFTQDGSSLSFGPMASTMMMCMGDSQAGIFAQDLSNVVSFVMQDGHLFLAIFADTGIMEFAPLASEPEAEMETSSLAGASWQWIQTQSGDGSFVQALDPTRYTLTFNEDSSLSAQLDCNRGMGSFTDDGGMLSLGPIASTMMGCPEDSQADVFAQQLESVVSYVLQDGHLFLAQFADSGIMEFAPLEAEMDAEDAGEMEETTMLAGTSWQWIQTQSGDGSILEAGDPTRYTLTFNEDGSLSAQLDCNRGMGSFTQDGSMLSFGPIASTRMSCPPGSQADAFALQLDTVVSFVLQDGHLFLAQFADSGIMEFAPIE